MLTAPHIADPTRLRASIRRDVRRARRALDPSRRALGSQALCQRLARSGVLTRFTSFSAFFGFDGEVDLSAFTSRLEGSGKRLYMPVIRGRRLWFLPMKADTVLDTNRFGIAEPRCRADRRLPLLALDVVLMPLVAFDRSGHRIGMGGGYYDRTFAFKRFKRSPSRPLLIGIGFEFQCVDMIPAEPWDVPLDAAVTDRTFRWFGQRGRGYEMQPPDPEAS